MNWTQKVRHIFVRLEKCLGYRKKHKTIKK